MRRKGVIGIGLSAIVLVGLSAAAQTQYKVIDLGTLAGGAISNAYAVNDLTQIVGTSQVTGGFNHGFLWMKPHGMKDLGTLGDNFSSAQAVNDASEIVGQAATSQSTSDVCRAEPARHLHRILNRIAQRHRTALDMLAQIAALEQF